MVSRLSALGGQRGCRCDLTLVCSPVELLLLQGRYCVSPAKLCLAPFFVQGSSGPGAFLPYIVSTAMHILTLGCSCGVDRTVSMRAARRVIEGLRAPQRPTLVLGSTS